MIKRVIYILAIVTLTLKVGYSKKNDVSTAALNDSLREVVALFGEYADLIVEPGKQGRATEEGEILFRKLFESQNPDTLQVERDSLIIFNFIGPLLNITNCLNQRSDSAITTCLNEKRMDKNLDWEITVNDYVSLMREWYSRSISRVVFRAKVGKEMVDLSMISMIDVEDTEIRVKKRRFQKTAVSPIHFEGRWKLPEYMAEEMPNAPKGGDVTIDHNSKLRLRYFISYEKSKIEGIERVYDFKIDSIAFVALGTELPPMVKNNTRGYIDPWIKIGSGSINPDFEDAGFDVNTVNGTNLGIGANYKMFFNNRDISRFDIGAEVGLGIDRSESRFGIANYSTRRTGLESPLNSDDVKNYELRVKANGVQQSVSIMNLVVPIKFHMVYNFNHERTMGVYFSTGFGLNVPVNFNTKTTHGEIHYQGAYDLLDPTNGITSIVLDNIDAYSYGIYGAKDGSPENIFNPLMVSSITDFGWLLTNKTKTFSFYIGPYFNASISNVLNGSKANQLLSVSYGETNPVPYITEQTSIFDWGIKFGVSIALFQEKLVPRLIKEDQ